MGGQLHVRYAQEPAHRHVVHFEAIALLLLYTFDEALERRVDHLLAVESAGGNPNSVCHVKEGPSLAGKFAGELAVGEAVRNGLPGAL